MKCAWVQERLLLYLAAELSATDIARIGDHLERCRECTASLQELAESQETLRTAIRTTVHPPDSLDARILQRIQALPRRRFFRKNRLPGWSPKAVFALAACALALVTTGYQWGRWNAGTSAFQGTPETLSMHPTLNLAALTETHRTWKRRTESPPTGLDATQVAAQLSQQTGLHVPPLDVQDRSLQLKGSMVLRIDHIPVAMRQYDWNGIPVSLAQADGVRLEMPYSLRELRHHGRCFLIHQNEGLTYIFWCEGTDNFVLVARVPPAQLFTLTYKMCAQLRHG